VDKSLLISRAFWILFTLEAIGCGVFIFWTPHGTKGWGPEGPVGGWLVYVPPILLAIPLLVVVIGRSKNATLVGLIILLTPVVPAVLGPIYSALQNYRADRDIAGDLNFFLPSQRKLAHALSAHDVEQVKTLLPRAGNLNAKHFGQSLYKADKSPASLEIVKAMLDHGANPNQLTSNKVPVLLFAIGKGFAMTKLMLDAGANLNYVDNNGQPVWWDVLYHDTPEDMQMLKMFLDRGADLTLRDSNGGVVARAAGLKTWRAVWLLMERGAAWKGQLVFSRPISEALESDLESRRSAHEEIPEEMAKIRAKLASEDTP
jgi:hypothetical protein